MEFLPVLLTSPTFWPWTLGLSGLLLALALTGAGIWRLRWGGQLHVQRNLRADESGSANAVDFTLTLPILLVIALLIVQVLVLFNDVLIVHYAAYCAARSARVWYWDGDLPRIGIITGQADARWLHNPLAARSRDQQTVRQRVEQAARLALIPAAPVVLDIPGQPERLPEGALRAMAEAGGHGDRAGPLLRQARYAFDPANSRIDYGMVDASRQPLIALDLLKPGEAWPVTATVAFKLCLTLPVAREVLGRDDGNGRYTTTVTAEVTLL
ncbi:MAG: pilus assembly protein [Candidatus Competibacter sp.]|nr:pilus assembly protein [Candidatus Competibacter sp.]